MMGEDDSIVHKNFLTLLYLNCRGLQTKLDELLNLLQETETDISALNEIFLTAIHCLYSLETG